MRRIGLAVVLIVSLRLAHLAVLPARPAAIIDAVPNVQALIQLPISVSR
jgi:hypothetical protein